jgi:hypothetical protein
MHVLHILSTSSIFWEKCIPISISAYFSNFPDFFCQKFGINKLKIKQFFFSKKSLRGSILVFKNMYIF